MKIIKPFSSFSTTENIINVYTRLYNLKSGDNQGKKEIYGETFIFTNEDNYTHAFIHNTAMPALTIPKENVIGMSFEPIEYLNLTPAFVNYAKRHIGKYFIGSHADKLGKPFINHYGYLWHLTPIDYKPPKNKIASIMISIKQSAPGHIYRHHLAQHILKTNLPIDIWGNGCSVYKNVNDTRLKGKFEHLEPYNDYLFHICIENFKKEHYFSEKITNTLLCSTTPLYIGCSTIDTYFPDNIITLSGNINEDMALLTKICQEPFNYTKNIDYKQIINTISIENVVNRFDSTSN